MTRTSVDPATGNLLVGGKPLFPIGLSNPPPLGSTAPDGADAWAEIAQAGVRFVRNYTVWTAGGVAEQLISVGQELDAAPAYGLQLWLALAGVDGDLSQKALLDQIVNTVKGHPGLGAWKGVDEPAHGHVPAAGMRRGVRAPPDRRSGPPDRDHPGSARAEPRRGQPRHTPEGSSRRTVFRRLRHPRHRHLPAAPGGARGRTAHQHRHQRRRRHDDASSPAPRGGSRSGRPSRSPGAVSSRPTQSSSRPCHRRGSWPTTRSSPGRVGCSSSAASSSR